MSELLEIEFVVNGHSIGSVPWSRQAPLTLETLFQLIVHGESSLAGKALSFAWKDEEDDEILIESDADLEEAMQTQTQTTSCNHGSNKLRFLVTAESFPDASHSKKVVNESSYKAEAKPLSELSVEDVVFLCEKLKLPSRCAAVVREEKISGRLLSVVECLDDLRHCGLTESVLSWIHAQMLLKSVLEMQQKGVSAKYLRSCGVEAERALPSFAVIAPVAVAVPLSDTAEARSNAAMPSDRVPLLQRVLDDKEEEINRLKTELQNMQKRETDVSSSSCCERNQSS